MNSWKWKIAQWFELRWWSNYLHGKNKEQYLNWKRKYWENLLTQISDVVKINAECKVADLGCGPAGVFIALPKNSITAIDPLLNEYENGTSFFKKTEYSNVHFVSTPIEQFSLEQKFDLVFCMNAINHVSNIEIAYDKLKECMTSNGTLIVSIDAHNHNFFKHLFRLIPGDVLHPHQYDLGEYELFLQKRGLKILKRVLLKKEFFFSHYMLVAE